jgi:hypothetical protein
MGEGFGDYLAASFYADLKSPVLKPCVGSWDAVSYSSANPPNLRRVDSQKKFPDDMEGEEHADGEIWSACLWELRTALGGKKADQLVLAHHFLIPPTATFRDAAEALVTADQNLNQGQNEATIRDSVTSLLSGMGWRNGAISSSGGIQSMLPWAACRATCR